MFNSPRSRLVVILSTAAFAAVALLGGASSDAVPNEPAPTTEANVVAADGSRPPAVPQDVTQAFEAEMRGTLPGYRFNPGRSFENVQAGAANYLELVGSAPGLGSVTTTVYRHFDAAELRSAGLAETHDPSVGTFWVGALDADLTSVYFQSIDGSAIWLGVQSSSVGGPAAPLQVMKKLAISIADLPAVQTMAAQ